MLVGTTIGTTVAGRCRAPGAPPVKGGTV